MGRSAAFFDLDRTLLRGASGPVIGAALREAGILPPRHLPGEGVVFKVFDVIGETLPSVALARKAATVAAGWSADAMVEAARAAADVLSGNVQPWARQLMEQHRAAGRAVVLATTTPFDVVRPLAASLGLDDVIATRYRRTVHGGYDGTALPDFVRGTGKLAAVRAWAEENDVDLSHCWAYTDSVFDTPLLHAVGYPAVVNPDPRLQIVAKMRRWPVLHLDAPPGVPKVAGVEPMAALRPVLRPTAFPFARFEITGTDAIPRKGAAILAANHRSYFDPIVVAMAAAKAGRTIRFLGGKEVLDAPFLGTLAKAIGTIRVEGDGGSATALEQAARALDAGEIVALMPQGEIPRGSDFFDPELTGGPGVARLVKATGAPVVPVGLWGTERVWPRKSKVPRLVTINPPHVRAEVGQPITGLRGADAAVTHTIMRAINDLLPPEAHVRRTPSAGELEATYPGGKLPDA